MAQRGGSVSSHVRFGEKVYSPIIKMGDTDYLFMTEKMETLRWLGYCNASTVILIDDVEINPPIVNLGDLQYPNDIEQTLKKYFNKFSIIPATKMAADLGNERAANVVLLGALSTLLAIDTDIWLKCLLSRLPQRLQELNKRAFMTGREVM